LELEIRRRKNFAERRFSSGGEVSNSLDEDRTRTRWPESKWIATGFYSRSAL